MKDLIFSMIMEKLEASSESLEEKVDEPYAVGMAAAMKATGDRPPLKKSTIKKAHKIAKGIEKNEEVELDEADGRRIVDDLKSKGHHEEAGAMAHKHGLGRSYGPHFGMRSSKYAAETAFHKGYDKAAAEAKKKNEEVELDEAYYVTKGITQTHDKPFKTSTAAIAHANKEEDRTGRTHIVTHVKDGKIHKQWQYSPDHRGYASYTDYKGEDARSHGIKESVEQIDELSKKTLGSYVKKAGGTSLNSAGAHMADYGAHGNQKSFKKGINRAKGVMRAADRLTKEEVEQLDELSPNTLHSYIKKALDNKGMHDRYVGRTSDRDSKEKSARRLAGITSASGRLADKANQADRDE